MLARPKQGLVTSVAVLYARIKMYTKDQERRSKDQDWNEDDQGIKTEKLFLVIRTLFSLCATHHRSGKFRC